MASNLEARSILQGLFDKWNGKSEEVIKEAKVEDVQTTIKVQPTKLYDLHFVKNYVNPEGRQRFDAYFGKIYLCPCWIEEKEMVEADFNYLKMKGYSILEIRGKLGDKYKIPHNQRHDPIKPRGAFSKDKYSFRKSTNGRKEFYYRFDTHLEKVCNCGGTKNEMRCVVKDCKYLIKQGKSKEEVKAFLKKRYNLPPGKTPGNKTNFKNKQSIHKEAPKVPLANYSWNDRGFLLKNGENTKIVPADFNDIESVLINNGSTRSVVSLLPNCDYEALMDLSKYCKTDEYAALRRAGIEIMNNK